MAYFGQTRRFVGDPGFFGTLGSIAGRVVRGAVGLATGGPLGAIAGVLSPGGGGAPRQKTGGIPSTFNPPFAGPAGVGFSVGGQASKTTTYAASATLPMPSANGCPKGYQPAKVYVPGMGYQRVGHCVKVRSRNPYNKRAATRAAARLSSLGRGMKTIRKSVKSAARSLD